MDQSWCWLWGFWVSVGVGVALVRGKIVRAFAGVVEGWLL